MATKTFVIKDQGKGTLTSVPIENIVELTGASGGSSSSGEPSSSIIIPTPTILMGDSGLKVFFRGSDRTFLTKNPEIFLMRWTKLNRSRGSEGKKYGWHWRHPSTSNADTKWAGWKFFGGKHKFSIDGASVPDQNTELDYVQRLTEWPVLNTTLPYQKIDIDFDKYMFWRYINKDDRTIVDYNLTTLPMASVDGDDIMHSNQYSVTSFRTRSKSSVAFPTQHPQKTSRQKFCVVIAIDNPAATKTNGLCPKIFSDYSNPFVTSLEWPDGIAIRLSNKRGPHGRNFVTI